MSNLKIQAEKVQNLAELEQGKKNSLREFEVKEQEKITMLKDYESRLDEVQMETNLKRR